MRNSESSKALAELLQKIHDDRGKPGPSLSPAHSQIAGGENSKEALREFEAEVKVKG